MNRKPPRPFRQLDGYIEIPCTQGQVAYIDLIDIDLAQFRWCVIKSPDTFYDSHTDIVNGKKRPITLHIIILQRKLDRTFIKGEMVDHINGNGMDNRRNNLRLATDQQNQANEKLSRNNTSGYKGVNYDKRNPYRPWKASLTFNYKQIFLGNFATAEEAYQAYCEGAKRYFGEFARFK